MDKETRLTTPAKILIAVIIVIAVVLVQFLLLPWLGFGTDREMSIVGTGRGFTYDFDSGAAFHSNDSRFFYFATRDAIRYVASNEVLVWSETFSFNNPWLAARGDYVAIGEESGGRIIRVFDSDGPVFHANFENPVLAFWINETGFVSAIVQYERGYGVYVLNRHLPNPENPFFHFDIYSELIFPMFAEVSADGRYIAVATTDLNFEIVRTSVQFRYTSQWDAWATDRGLFATEEFPDQFITAMQFMNNNRLVIATTSQIVGFQLGPGHTISRRMWDIQLDNAKTHIEFYNGTHFAFAIGDRLPMAASEGDPLGMVRIYGINGVETGTFELGRRATHLRMGHNSVIVGGDRSFHAMDFRGNPLWEHTSLFDTRDVLFLDNTNIILVAGSIQAEIFERRRLRDSDFEDEFEFDFDSDIVPEN
ncbi:MAG: DUF5711 family protein [Defluviitaleaceae bacterium]|nr:DUF5711 family protein [Defluviitaleaceae bacterium]